MNIICNGIPVGGNIGGIGSGGLTINKNVTNSETSTWAFSLLMIWDQHLTDEEVFYLNKLVDNYINNGIPIKKMIDSAENLKISNNGNIGIGVANPTSLCNINGHITTKLYYYSRTTTTIPSDTLSFAVCFSTLIQDLNMTGNIITYTSDVTNGDYFQINKTGLYLINVMLGNTNSNAYFWIDKNNTNTDDCLVNANTLFVKSKIDSNDESISFRGVLNNNDIIRIKSGFITSLITSDRYTLNITYLMETI